MSTNYTLRSGFSSCSPIAFSLTNAVKLFTHQHGKVRVAAYTGTTVGESDNTPIFVVQVKVGDGKTATYTYSYARSFAALLNTPTFKAIKLRAAWHKRSTIRHAFCGIRFVDIPLAGGSAVRLYVVKDNRNAIVSSVRTGAGRNATYSYAVATIPAIAVPALGRLTSFFSGR